MRTTDWEANTKYQAIRALNTQKENECSVFLRFLHRDELFFAEEAKSAYAAPIVNAGEDQVGCEGETIYLDGSKTTVGSDSSIRKKDLIFSWTQSSGPKVELRDANTARPHFVFKSETPISSPAELEFELTVKNPYTDTSSFPNSVVVTVMPSSYRKYGSNIAPYATVTASSQTMYTGQVAQAAVDGVVDGLLRVSPTEFGSKKNEWVAEGERGSAWIELNWVTQVDVGKVVLYDRISCKNHVLGGTLLFSDGSEIRVGELNNMGGPTTVEFEPKTVDRIRFTINSVSETTAEDGLAEIMVYEIDTDGFYCANNVKRGNNKKVVNNDVHEGKVDDNHFNNIEKTIRDDEGKDNKNKIKFYKNDDNDEDEVDDKDDDDIATNEKNEREKYKNRNRIKIAFNKKQKQKTFENNQENRKNNDEEVEENTDEINRPDNLRYTQDIKQNFVNTDENKVDKANEDKNEADDEDEEREEKKVVTENKVENEEEEEKEIAINAVNDREKEEEVIVGLTKTTENPTTDKDIDEKDKLGKNSIFMINGIIILVVILIAVGFKSNFLRKSINDHTKKGF